MPKDKSPGREKNAKTKSIKTILILFIFASFKHLPEKGKGTTDKGTVNYALKQIWVSQSLDYCKRSRDQTKPFTDRRQECHAHKFIVIKKRNRKCRNRYQNKEPGEFLLFYPKDCNKRCGPK